MQTKQLNNSGFSLLELSIVITIIAIIMTGYITWFIPASENDSEKINITLNKITQINDAIDIFVSTYGRLPCPGRIDIPYGKINSSGQIFDAENLINRTTCLVNGGNVPTQSLGILPEMMLDGWERKFVYVTSPNLCGASGCTAQSYGAGINGQLNIQNLSGSLIVNNAAYVIISTGPAGRGSFLKSGSRTTIPTSGSYPGEATNNMYNATAATTTNIFIQDIMNSNFENITFYRLKSQIESNIIDYSKKLVDLQTCINNTNYLSTVTANIAYNGSDSIRNQINTLQITDGVNIKNYGDEAILNIMWVLQETCYLMYPTQMITIKQCPGGGTYNSFENSCTCNNGSWSGSC